jgi:cob(I)alamin adenosyltransferase
MSDKDKKKESFSDPKLAINRVYTRKGDSGKTSLVGGQKVSKASLRIRCYGAVDELNAFTGVARQSIIDAENEAFAPLVRILKRVQHELFNLGSVLATRPEDLHEKQPRIRADEVELLENEIDEFNSDLPTLRSFVLPGGSRANVDLHVCRTVCRRVERLMTELYVEEGLEEASLAWVNRLSDAFFVWSRWVVHVTSDEEVLWNPNIGSNDDS